MLRMRIRSSTGDPRSANASVMPLNLRQYLVTERSPCSCGSQHHGEDYVSHDYRAIGSPGRAKGGVGRPR
jgi:hypothetical protein